MYLYLYEWTEQWAVGIMGCRNNGPSELWVVGIMTRTRTCYTHHDLLKHKISAIVINKHHFK